MGDDCAAEQACCIWLFIASTLCGGSFPMAGHGYGLTGIDSCFDFEQCSKMDICHMCGSVVWYRVGWGGV